MTEVTQEAVPTAKDNEVSKIDQKSNHCAEQQVVGIREALKEIFAWKNYKIYVSTAWVFNAFFVMQVYLNLYLRYIGWDYLTIGVVTSISIFAITITRFLSGYVGDTVDRKMLSVSAMVMMGIYFLLMGISTEFLIVFTALLVYSLQDIARGGSSAYIMENIPKKHGGLAVSMFKIGGAFGILTLIVFGMLIPVLGFVDGFRVISITGGVLLLVCSCIRAKYLDASEKQESSIELSILRDFISENKRAAILAMKVMPGVLIIMALDATSDNLFRFASLIYTNEFLGVSVDSINLMILLPLFISIPLLLKIGRFSDTKGIKKAAMRIYAIMPICALLLVIAPIIPIWLPLENIASLHLVFGLEVVFTTPFLALALKSLNDILWGVLIFTIIQKNLPKRDTAKTLGIVTIIGYLASGLAPSIGGILFTFFNPTMLFFVVIGLNMIILIVIAKIPLETNTSLIEST
ncbi:MAG: MFS transporter [Candidatus Lokiarchaeota archaeon]|nr:MFS transporter [Candidatus Lokiarchaeota archaeon]